MAPVSNGLIQIVDREKLLNGPKEPTEANLKYPIVTQIDLPPESGTHTALPRVRHADARIREAEAAGQPPAAGHGPRARRHDSAPDERSAPRLPGGRRRDRPTRSASRTGSSSAWLT